MRSINAAILTAEANAGVMPRHALTAYNNLISFAAFTGQTNASLDTDTPQTFAVRAGGTYCYAAFRDLTGMAYLQVLTLGTAAHWALALGSAVGTNACMRNAVFTDDSNASWLYTADVSGAAIQVKRQQINGSTTNPITVSLTDYGPTFGGTLTDTSALVRRVEAVCPTNNGVIVAVGTHDFTNSRSTLLFYWIPDNTTCYQLNAIIQAPLTDTYTAWYACAKWATYISATYNSTTGKLWVFANDHPAGRAATFSLCNGIESHVRPVVPIDPDIASCTFRPSAVSKVGSLYYLCGRYGQTFEDGATLGYDCYLTSADAEYWSFGERNSFLTESDCAGKFLYDGAPATPLYYYGGNLIVYRADASYDDGVSSRATTLKAQNWSLNQITNGADSLTCELDNSDGALDSDANLKEGCTVKLRSGQGATLDDIGAYVMEEVQGTNSVNGREPVRGQATDAASYRIIRHNSPLDIDLWGCDKVESDLSTLDHFTVKTPSDSILQLDPDKPTNEKPSDYDVVIDSTNHLVSKARNNPLVAYADTSDARDGLVQATVTFTATGEAHHLSTFGFVFAGSDDNAFNAYLIPKDGDWKTKTGPRVVHSRLQPYNATADTGGFKLTPRESGLWAADAGMEGSYNPITEELAVQAAEGTWAAAEGTTYELAARYVGRRVQVYAKVRDYEPTTMAGNATTSVVSAYAYGDDESRYQPSGQNRLGFVVNTDVWADKTAYDHGAYAAQELSLTSAQATDSPNRYLTAANPPGVTQWDFDLSPGTHAEAYNGASPSTTDLTLYFHAGQRLRTFGNNVSVYRNIDTISYVGGKWRITFVSGANPAQGLGACGLYIKSADDWALASSVSVARTIPNDSVPLWIDPGAIKTVTTLTGWGVFTGNDPTDLLYWPAWVDSDGKTHYLLDKAWDGTTNPIAEANSWKLMLHHNAIGKWSASVDKGLSSTGRMTIDTGPQEEIVRYAETTITLFRETLVNPGFANTQAITYVPLYYAIPQTQGAASTTISNYTAGLFANGVQDDLGPTHVTDAAGLLCEITGRSGGGASSNIPNVYVTSNGNNAGDSDRGFIVIDRTPAGPILATDMVVVSGFGQFDTKHTTHASDAIVCYYPRPISATTPLTSLVTVSRFDAYTGAYRCIEDNLKYLCALAGVRSFVARNYHTSATVKTPFTATLTATPQALPLAANVSDFVLDCSVHINGTNRLQIDFRNYYRLTLLQSSAGQLEVGLQAPNDTAITASSGIRWLKLVQSIPLNAAYDFGAATNVNVPVRVAVQGGRVQVDVAGQLAWVFNTAAMVSSNGTSWDKRTASGISVSYSATTAGNSCTFRVLELGNEDPNVVLPQGFSSSDKIRDLCDRWHIKSRTTATGGLEFGRFKTRDDAGAFAVNTFVDQWTYSAGEGAGQFQVSGKAAAGATIDATWIAAHGYRFAALQSDADLTADGAGVTATSALREVQEYANQRRISAWGLLAVQPEDKIALAYAVDGTNEYPAHASSNHVVTSGSLRVDNPEETTGDYTLRDYIA